MRLNNLRFYIIFYLIKKRLKAESKKSKIEKQELEVEKYKKYYELELRKLEDMKKKFGVEGVSNS